VVGGSAAAVLLAVGLGADGTGAAACRLELFRIARSTNANVVVYEARPGPAGGLDPAEPLEATWLMLAEDGRREPLNAVERALAYGLDARADPAGGWTMFLRAAPDRPVRLRERAGCPAALASIEGREAVLRLVHVDATGGLLPQVRSIELVGVDAETGREVREVLPGES
jgi:hypothetical protein